MCHARETETERTSHQYCNYVSTMQTQSKLCAICFTNYTSVSNGTRNWNGNISHPEIYSFVCQMRFWGFTAPSNCAFEHFSVLNCWWKIYIYVDLKERINILIKCYATFCRYQNTFMTKHVKIRKHQKGLLCLITLFRCLFFSVSSNEACVFFSASSSFN